ncbi:rRNA-binding ribosome biosynthesis protein [Saccharomycopsis crataegensis]|uniref:U three protein 23 n=1 Tax=Saccharomycopsis crataegensis TaxID=43959 RepID=A0AAV5QER6_9ASCO|nr:rRNA-binding ribosome biosynthesis protein [Saccharomycopsis crataegensis]
MRQKRSKSYRKQMLVYNHAFKFRAPYQIIVDHEIVEVADHSGIDLVKYLKNTVQDEVKPMITQCCMQKLYESKNQSAISLAKNFERRRCGHKDQAIDPYDCIDSIIDIKGQNKHRYVVCTQSIDLRRKLRHIPGVPLLYMNRSVMIMEPLSNSSDAKQKQFEQSKLSGGLNDIKAGKLVKGGNSTGEAEKEKAGAKRKRGPKEPNPLSMKKKKPTAGDNKQEEGPKKKRRRKHGNKNSEDKQDDGAEDNTDNGAQPSENLEENQSEEKGTRDELEVGNDSD